MIRISKLHPLWQAVWAPTPAKVRAYLGPFLDFLNARKVMPFEVRQDHLDDWWDTFTGPRRCPGHHNTVVRCFNSLREAGGNPLPQLAPASTIHDRRAAANAAIDPGLLQQISDYVDDYLPTTTHEPQTVNAIGRRLLDGARILTANNWAYGGFDKAFATSSRIKRFIAFFEPDPAKRTVIERRVRIIADIRDLLLEARCYPSYNLLKCFYVGLPKASNALSSAAIARIDASENARIMDVAVATIQAAFERPAAHAVSRAQAAVALLCVGAKLLSRAELASVRFGGHLRDGSMPRPTLIFDSRDGGTINLDDDATMSRLVDAYFVAALEHFGRDPIYLFEDDLGNVKNVTTITNSVKRLTKRAGVGLSPTDLVTLNFDLLIKSTALEDWELCDLARRSSGTNVGARFEPLRQRLAALQIAGDETGP